MASKKTNHTGVSFQFKLPSEGLALRSVTVENGTPRLIFDPALKVPTLTEEDVGIACRLACEESRPEFFYKPFPMTHPYFSRQYMHHNPAWLRGTSVGELLSEADWTMKCLHIGARSDKKKEKFWAWQETSNLEGLANVLDFPDDNFPGSVIMSCESVEVQKSENELVFVGEPKMTIKDDGNSTYTKYISEIYPSIAYHDEPLFLKIQELIKLIVATEWLIKEKKVRFSRKWMMECSAAKSQEASQAVEVKSKDTKEEEAREIIGNFEKQLPQATHKEVPTEQGAVQLDVSVEKTATESGIEASITTEMQSSFSSLKIEKTTTVRASVHDHDMVYKGEDPNMPILPEIPGVCTAVVPKVQSWSELFSQTVPWPRVWLLPFEGAELLSTTGGVSTSTIPVTNRAPVQTSSQVKAPSKVTASVPVREEQYEACNGQLHVLAQQGGAQKKKRKRVPQEMVPQQTIVTPPKKDVTSETDQTLQNRSLEKRGAKRGYGYVDQTSGEGVIFTERGERMKQSQGVRHHAHIQGRLTGGLPTHTPPRITQQGAPRPVGAAQPVGAPQSGSTPSTSGVHNQPSLAPLPLTEQQVPQAVRAATNDLLSPASSMSSMDSGFVSLPGAHPNQQSQQETDVFSDGLDDSGHSSDSTVEGDMDQG